MTNHYHLVIETPEGNLSQGMRQLNGVYTQTINRRHLRVGHVIQGRYQAILVEKDRYLLELARYVVLNPVRARMVKQVGNWPWSSYQVMTGAAPVPAGCRPIGSLARSPRPAAGRSRNTESLSMPGSVAHVCGKKPAQTDLSRQRGLRGAHAEED